MAKSQAGLTHVLAKQNLTSTVIINQLALTEALNEMKRELFEKAIESHHTRHESSLKGTFIKSEFITFDILSNRFGTLSRLYR